MIRKSFGLIGEKLSHSISDTLHQEIMKEMSLNGSYNMFEVKRDDLKDVIKSMTVLGISGINVTIPYKEDIMKYLDSIDEKALEIGAVNTVAIEDGKAIGYNTDYDGFKFNLEKAEIDILDKSFTLLGAGGGAKAVISVLIDGQAREITIVSRNPDETRIDYPDIKVISYNEMNKIENKYCLINCTPVGTFPNIEDCPLDEDEVKPYKNVVDLIYNPEKTKLLKLADKYGLNNINGLFMLIGQARKSQEIWSSKNK